MDNLGTPSSDIKPINENTVHKICSGQVVLNLAVAVKELVENSLDAGATKIDIRCKNYGMDSIEVSDNGSGVNEDNFAALTLKYHTSKLSDYSDLLGVSSFGFRGEALSSLCALANLTVTTRHKNSNYATKIEYDLKGNIVKTTPCSRQIGTTVTCTNLFHSLPVRQKEFHNNVKREFNKMTHLLYAYCLISIGVKITCTNQASSNTKSVVVETHGSSYKDNIASIFGLKQLQTIIEIKPEYTQNIKDNIFKGLSSEVAHDQQSFVIEDVDINLSEDSNDNESEAIAKDEIKSQGYKNIVKPFEFIGFVSSCEHGRGRSSTDRQFFFVNNRPCEPIKITKLINEVYRQYNPNQYPFVFLNVNVERSSVDINLTPDKRKLFLTKERNILDVLKVSLLKLFESIPRTLKVDSSQSVSISKDHKPELDQPRIFTSFLQQFDKKSKLCDPISKREDLNKVDLKRKSTAITDYITMKSKRLEQPCSSINESKLMSSDINTNELLDSEEIPQVPMKSEGRSDDKNVTELIPRPTNIETPIIISDQIKSEETEITEEKEIIYLDYCNEMPNTQIKQLSEQVVEQTYTINCKTKTKPKIHLPPGSKKTSESYNKVLTVTDKEDLGKNYRRSVILKTSLQHVQALTEIYNRNKEKILPTKVKFKSAINPVFNKKCEEELIREISKDSFKKMHIVGQFNLGFIITQLEDDLFVIDQHATDEIYNFETLQRTTELTSQKLVIPQQLELTGVNEEILMDNIDIFKKNGFTFEVNKEALPTKRVKLLTIPMSKNWLFGKEDIEEMLFMLREAPSEHCRPSRVRAMFASRACRKSVMIGTALKKSDMRTLVDHMAEIDKPWNCPHGRPTIRHLVNLAMVQTEYSSGYKF